MSRVLKVLLLAALLPARLDAQIAVRLAWDPSPDPNVAGYVIAYGAAPGIQTESVNVGVNTAYSFERLPDGPTYYFVVRAYNAGGQFSAPSNEVIFSTPAACNPAFSQYQQSVGSTGGQRTFSLSTGAACNWNVQSNASWVTVLNPSGTGGSQVNYRVAPNPTNEPRTAIVYSGNRSVTITQAGRKPNVIDMDGDGLSDVIWQHTGTGHLALWRMNGTDLLSADYLNPAVADSGWRMVGTMDLDRNGQTDLVFQDESGSLAAWRMDGDTRVEVVPIAATVTPGWRVAGFGDVDRDGFADVVLQHDDSRVRVLYLNGTSLKSDAVLAQLSDNRWKVAAVADLNGDGDVDILWHHQTWGQLASWNLKNGSYRSNGPNFVLANLQWQVATAADFDGDGKVDLIWRNRVTGELAIWYMDNGHPLSGWALNPGRVDPNWSIVGPR